MPKPHENLIDKTFGRLTGIRRVANSGHHTRWLWKCECGEETIAAADKVKSGHTISCGCAHDAWTIHGHTYGIDKRPTRTYRAWVNMRSRARGYNIEAYIAHYVSRGIKVCERWQDFANFLDDMGECPKGLSLDRIDNDGDYKPGNCRWATRIEQMANTRKTIRVDINGEIVSLTEAARRAGLPYSTVFHRFKRLGMTPQEALRHNSVKVE